MSELSPYETITRIFNKVRDTDASLNARLLMLAEAIKQASPSFYGAAEALIARLAQSGCGERAPAVGEPLPPFLLPDLQGRLTGLAEILSSGPAVVSFLRGNWCPYCRLTASALAKVQDSIGPGRMVAITPEFPRRNLALATEAGIGYRVLTDASSGYALSLNLAFWVDDAFADLMRSVGQDLGVYQAGAAWLLPIPATFVVNRRGVIVARHVDPDYRRRFEIEDLAAALEAAD